MAEVVAGPRHSAAMMGPQIVVEAIAGSTFTSDQRTVAMGTFFMDGTIETVGD